MALLVTLFLVLVNIFNAITTNSPKADGLNALQVGNILGTLLGINWWTFWGTFSSFSHDSKRFGQCSDSTLS